MLKQILDELAFRNLLGCLANSADQRKTVRIDDQQALAEPDEQFGPLGWKPADEFKSIISRAFEHGVTSAEANQFFASIGSKIDYREFGPGNESDRDWLHETLAWYSPFHFHREGFGIYFRSEALYVIAIQIVNLWRSNHGAIRISSPELVTNFILRAAFLNIISHERFHFEVECFCTKKEIMDRISLYVPYINNVYKNSIGTDDLLEEGLAVARERLAMQECGRRRANISLGDAYVMPDDGQDAFMPAFPIISMAEEWVDDRINSSRLPPGYRNASRLSVLDGSIEREERRLICAIIECNLTGARSELSLELARPLLSGVEGLICPVFEICPRDAGPIVPIGPHPRFLREALAI